MVPGNRTWRWLSLAAVAACLTLLVTGCSNSPSSTTGISPTATITVSHFRYSGMPATLKSGVVSFLFQNRESFPITHEMIPIALPSGKTADDVTAEAKSKGPASEDEWLDNIIELGWQLYLCSSPPYLYQTSTDRRMRDYTHLAFKGEHARAKAVRDSLNPVREAFKIASTAGSTWSGISTISIFTLGRKSTTYSAPR